LELEGICNLLRSHAVRHVDAIGLFAGSARYRRAQIVPVTLEVRTI
jgi:hypothetical protein